MQSDSGYHFIADFLQCQQKFFWNYIQGLIPEHKSKHLLFGDAIHEALAFHYKNSNRGNYVYANQRVQETIEKFEEVMEKNSPMYKEPDTFVKDRERGIVLLLNYFNHYKNDYFGLYKPVKVEELVERRLPSGMILTGTIDLVPGIEPYHIVDHKTTGWSISKLCQSFQTSQQATAYLGLYPQAEFVIFNILYQNQGVTNFHREIIYRTKKDIERYLKQADILLCQIAEKSVRDTDPDLWHRNDRACMDFNNKCEYFDLCRGENYALLARNFKKREVEGEGNSN